MATILKNFLALFRFRRKNNRRDYDKYRLLQINKRVLHKRAY